MKSKLVISKQLNGGAITVSISNSELSLSVGLEDFLLAVAQESRKPLASDATRNAGNPTLLITNAQLLAKVESSLVAEDVFKTLYDASQVVLRSIKNSSVVAE